MNRDVTNLLADLRAGNRAVFDDLVLKVYDELQRMAHAQLRNERVGHTLNTTGLVHEAYLKLVDQRAHNWQNRAHFFGTAAQAMRRILVDHARSRQATKRNGQKITLEENGLHVISTGNQLATIIEIDDALDKLAIRNERSARVVECRYFAGLTIEETAEVLGVSHATVSEDWLFARNWLKSELAV